MNLDLRLLVARQQRRPRRLGGVPAGRPWWATECAPARPGAAPEGAAGAREPPPRTVDGVAGEGVVRHVGDGVADGAPAAGELRGRAREHSYEERRRLPVRSGQ